MQTHCQERTLGAGYDEVHAVLSVQPTRKAMVFVHGYGGDPLETWAAFDTLLPQEQKCGSADLFFYGYDGLYSELVASAGLFGNFLNDLMTRPAALINPVVPAAVTRPNDFQFDQVVLVAHSL